MKKSFFKKAFALALSCAMAFTALAGITVTDTFAASAPKTAENAVSMEFYSGTTVYQVGSSFKKDAKFKITFSADGYTDSTQIYTIKSSEYTSVPSNTDMKEVGTYTVEVAYGSQLSGSYTIEVKPKFNSMRIETKEEVQTLTSSDTYSFNGSVLAKFGSGSDAYEEDITSDLTYKDAETSKLGTRYVTLVYKYCGVDKELKNNVPTHVIYSDDKTITLTGIKIYTKPTKLEYNVGDTFSIDGIGAYAVFSDGGEREILPAVLEVSSVSTAKTAAENQTFNVSFTYNGVKKTSEDIAIKVNGVEKKELSGIEITKDATKSYTVGDSFSFDGTVTAKYSTGDTAAIDNSSLEITKPDMTSAGSKKVTVSYTEGGVTKSTTYTITVEDNAPEVPDVDLASLSSTKAKKLKVKWEEADDYVDGYQIQYSTSKDFSGAKSKYVKDPEKTAVNIGKLTSGKKYYVRIRAYIQDGKKYYGDWSGKLAKKVK